MLKCKSTMPRRRDARRRSAPWRIIAPLAALPLLQAGSCSPTAFREALLTELTQQVAEGVIASAETILLNLFGV